LNKINKKIGNGFFSLMQIRGNRQKWTKIDKNGQKWTKIDKNRQNEQK